VRPKPGAQRDEYYPQRFRLPEGAAGAAFAFLWGVGFGSAIFFAPGIGLLFGLIGWGVAAATTVKVWRLLAGRRRGLRLDDTGLTEYRWLAPPRHFSWEQIAGVDEGGQDALVITDSAELRLDDDLPGWRRLVARLQTAVGEPVEIGPDVPPETVEGWLEVPPGGSLDCRARHDVGTVGLALVWLAVTGVLTAFYAPFFWAGLRSDGSMRIGVLLFTLAHASIFFGAFSGSLLLKLLRKLRGLQHVSADGLGLHVRTAGGWRVYGWDELDRLRDSDDGWEVEVAGDTLLLRRSSANADRLASAIRRALAARDRGLRLPAAGVVPDGAISLARQTGGEVTDERGLSQADAPTLHT
jgi:hypothetical protein